MARRPALRSRFSRAEATVQGRAAPSAVDLSDVTEQWLAERVRETTSRILGPEAASRRYHMVVPRFRLMRVTPSIMRYRKILMLDHEETASPRHAGSHDEFRPHGVVGLG